MSHKKIWATIVAIGVIISLAASIGPAAQATRDAAEFLWPVGVVALLFVICLSLLWDRWKAGHVEPVSIASPANSDEGGPEPVDLANRRERREAAYSDVLTTSEAYINAHRAGAVFDEPDINVYVPDLEEANRNIEQANINFVTARHRVEQYGIDPILEAAQDLEDAINRGDVDKAAEIRRDVLVPAIRTDMKRPTAAFL